MLDGIAGENIIIDYEHEVWPEDLGKRIAIEDQQTGQMAFLDMVMFAAPCEEFSHFAAQSQHERLPADVLNATLQFLGNGRRGFLLLLSDGQDPRIVRPGDKVFVVEAG